MNINLQGKNFELTEALTEYVLKKVTNLEKLLSDIETSGGEIKANFEVGKSTKHHKSGDVFHADCLISINGEKFYYGSDKEDIYQAVDEVKERLYEEIRRSKDRKQTMFRRGAASVKKMLKGLSDRNPFTSKY
ncbi:MAG: ribosome-associated translation inhibitor RaiA [Burkholderiales bacterium]|nr:ribosome-associated translation inhibitor RaiA [Burkholderiales bacterium]